MQRRVATVIMLVALAVAGEAWAVDLTGTWRVVDVPDASLPGPELWDLTQGPGSLTIASIGTGVATGTDQYSFDLGPPPPPLDLICPNFSMTLAADGDGLSFSASASVAYSLGCNPFMVTYTGVRCGNAPATPAECIPARRPLSGRRLVVRDKAGVPSRRKLVLQSRDAGFLAPPNGSDLDPQLAGATITLARSAEESVTLSLPSAGWRPRRTGFGFADPTGALGPCRRAVVRDGYLTAVCVGEGIGFSLDEPSQGALDVSFSLGAENGGTCFRFGGTVLADDSSSTHPVGSFRAKNAGAPPQCPAP